MRPCVLRAKPRVRRAAGAAAGYAAASTIEAPADVPATCSKCGRATEVPFQPTTGKPVYCSDCFRSAAGN